MKFATVRVETTSERSGQADKRPPIKTACTAQCETQRNTCFPQLFRRRRCCSGTGASWPQGALLPLRVPPSERELHHTTTRSTGLFILCVVCVGGSAGNDSAQRARELVMHENTINIQRRLLVSSPRCVLLLLLTKCATGLLHIEELRSALTNTQLRASKSAQH